MSDNDVKIKVSLDGDKAVSEGLSGIGGSADKADSKLGNMAKGGLTGAGKALIGFATAAVVAGGALATGVIKQFAAYEQNVGGIETMFKDSAGKMEKYAQEAYKTAGLSANEYMSQATSFSAALLQGLGGDTDKAADIANRAMTDMSDNANKFGSDIGSIQFAYQGFAKQNYTMLDNLKLGFGGTAGEMARLVNQSGVMGDSFTATAQNINDVSYDKIIEAIGVVQDQMGITGTTAKEASETISGSIGMLRASFTNLLTGLGSADADVATLAGNVINSLQLVITNITPVIEAIGTNMAALGPELGTMMESLVGAISSAIPAVLEAGTGLIGGLIQGVTTALPSLITALVPGIVGLVDTLATLAPQLIAAGADAVVALAKGLADAAPQLIPSITLGLTGMLQAVITALPQLLQAGVQLVMGLATGILDSIPLLIAALPEMIDGIVTFIKDGVPMLLDAGVALFMGIVEALPEAITQILAVLPLLITSIIGAVVGAIPLLIDAGIKLLTALVTALPVIIDAIVGALPTIITSVLDALTGAIPQLVQGGIELFIALIKALPTIIVTIVKAIPQIITGIIKGITGAIPQLIMAGVQLLVSLVQNMPMIIGTIVAAIPQIITGIVGAIVGGFDQINRAGVNLVHGLWDGISGAAGWLFNKIGGFVNDVMSNIGKFFGIASPSKRMADEVGQYLPSGIGVGVAQNEEDALKPIRQLGSRIMDEAQKLNVSATMSTEASVTKTLIPMMATPTPQGASSVNAVFDSTGISRAIEGSFAGANRNQEPVYLSKESVGTLASAIVDSIRGQSRQGGVSYLG